MVSLSQPYTLEQAFDEIERKMNRQAEAGGLDVSSRDISALMEKGKTEGMQAVGRIGRAAEDNETLDAMLLRGDTGLEKNPTIKQFVETKKEWDAAYQHAQASTGKLGEDFWPLNRKMVEARQELYKDKEAGKEIIAFIDANAKKDDKDPSKNKLAAKLKGGFLAEEVFKENQSPKQELQRAKPGQKQELEQEEPAKDTTKKKQKLSAMLGMEGSLIGMIMDLIGSVMNRGEEFNVAEQGQQQQKESLAAKNPNQPQKAPQQTVQKTKDDPQHSATKKIGQNSSLKTGSLTTPSLDKDVHVQDASMVQGASMDVRNGVSNPDRIADLGAKFAAQMKSGQVSGTAPTTAAHVSDKQLGQMSVVAPGEKAATQGIKGP